MSVEARLDEIRDRMERATRRSGRDAGSVRLVAVSKTRSPEEIDIAARAGVTDIGENKVQEAETKKPRVSSPLRWHLIGHLQKNKAKKAVRLFDWIHSLDGVGIGKRLDRFAAEEGKSLSVLVQVDLAGEETKYGAPEEELFPTLEGLGACDNLRVQGLMILPPFLEDPEDVRPYFRRLRELSDEARGRGLLAGSDLSMGMSHDFEVAIEEGATLVRVGTAIFGPRPSKAEDRDTDHTLDTGPLPSGKRETRSGELGSSIF